MKKFLLSMTISTALMATVGGVFYSTYQAANNALSAYADEVTTPTPIVKTLVKDDLDLLLPSSYEQYLTLTEASGVAVKGNRIAIADGDTVYVYNGTEYLTYTHTADVVQLELSPIDETLYLLDENGNLKTMDVTAPTLTVNDYNLSCSSFTLSENGVYYARSVLSKTNLYHESDVDNPIAPPLSSAATVVPCMSYADGKLYYTDGQYLNILSNDAIEDTIYLKRDVYDIAVKDGVLYYTDKNSLHLHDITSDVEITKQSFTGSNYTSLSLDGTFLYVAKQTGLTTSIERFNVEKNEFSDYQIATASPAPNRLQNGKKSVVSGDYLLTADTNRVVAYDFVQKRYQSFTTALNPVYIASNVNTFAVADTEQIAIYDFEGNLVNSWQKDGSMTDIMGVATSKDGDYYLVGANGTRAILPATQGANATTQSNNLNAKELTSDIEGNLYLLSIDNKLYKYTESQFLSTASGTALYDFAKDVKNIAVDLFGNAYALDNNKIITSKGDEYTVDASGYLYGAPTSLQAFAFGYEYGEVYLVFKDYVLSTKQIDLPNLRNVNAGNAYQTVFTDSKEGGVIKMVNLNQNAVFLHFNLSELNENSTVFPYTSYSKAQNVSALVLGDTTINNTPYHIVTTFSAVTRKYTAGLVKQSACVAVNESEYANEPSGFTDSVGFLTNDVTLYKYPYLTDKLTVANLPKNGVVTVIKELSLGEELMDYDYYYVSFTGENGSTLYGYIPTAYLRAFNGDKNGSVPTKYQTYQGDRDVTATSTDGKTITLTAGVEYKVTAYYTGVDQNTAVIAYEENGVKYYATVACERFIAPSTDVLRWFLVALLSLSVVILVVNYVLSKIHDEN